MWYVAIQVRLWVLLCGWFMCDILHINEWLCIIIWCLLEQRCLGVIICGTSLVICGTFTHSPCDYSQYYDIHEPLVVRYYLTIRVCMVSWLAQLFFNCLLGRCGCGPRQDDWSDISYNWVPCAVRLIPIWRISHDALKVDLITSLLSYITPFFQKCKDYYHYWCLKFHLY